jgi:hypothetical protein|tara:strand:+ start:4273 stop:4467 length:195 start_codon:yes stop_codon:yes gene_type:complete
MQSMKKLSARQNEMLKLHAKPHENNQGKTVAGHSQKHIKAMKVMMQHGMSFSNAHDSSIKLVRK